MWRKWHEQYTKEHPPADKSQFPRWQFEGNKNEGWRDYPQDVQVSIREHWDPTLQDMAQPVYLHHQTGDDWNYLINVFTMAEAATNEQMQKFPDKPGMMIVGYQETASVRTKGKLRPIRIVLTTDELD